MSLYTSDTERLADILQANASTKAKFCKTENGRLAYEATSEYERVILEEEKAAALARLAIDKASRR